MTMTLEYAFEQPDGRWQHRSILDFRDEAHAKEWAVHTGLKYKDVHGIKVSENAPGSASWCETQSDNRKGPLG